MKVTVIGAGFSGLVTAYYLRKRGVEVEVLERSEKVGGLISTLKTDYGLIETAANALMNNEMVEELFRDLDVPLEGTRKNARKRYIFRGHPRRWPLNFFESLSLVASLLLKFLFGFKKSMRPLPSESVAQWSERNFGRKFLEYLIGPALQGIYAGDPQRLSASLILAPFFEEKPIDKKPKKKTMLRGSVAPARGMGQLIEALQLWLKKNQVKILTNTEVIWDPKLKNWRWVIATSASEAEKILQGQPVAEMLRQIEISPVVSVTAFFHPLDARNKGFGILFPRDQGVRALGVLFNNEIFEGRSDYRSETWIYGGALDHEVCEFSEPEIMSQLMKDRKNVERGISKPLHCRIQRWPAAIPHYTVDLEKLLAKLPRVENTYLIGNYLGGLGLAKILRRASELSELIASEIPSDTGLAPRKEKLVEEERRATH